MESSTPDVRITDQTESSSMDRSTTAPYAPPRSWCPVADLIDAQFVAFVSGQRTAGCRVIAHLCRPYDAAGWVTFSASAIRPDGNPAIVCR